MLCLRVRYIPACVGERSLRLFNMELNKQITAAIFSAFVKCPTKAYLLASGEHTPDAYFTELRTRVSSNYKKIASRQVLPASASRQAGICSLDQLLCDQEVKTADRQVDCETAVYDFPSTKRASYRNHVLSGNTIPILFVPSEKPDSSDSLLTCFGALALSQVIGKLPTSGTLIYGDSYRRKTVSIESHVARTREIIDAIMAPWREQKPPTVVLNRHCVVCDFQPRC